MLYHQNLESEGLKQKSTLKIFVTMAMTEG